MPNIVSLTLRVNHWAKMKKKKKNKNKSISEQNKSLFQ